MVALSTSYDVKSGDRSTLASSISATATSGIKAAAININGSTEAWQTASGVVEIRQEIDNVVKVEWFAYGSISADSDNVVTFGDVSRGLSRTGSTFTGTGTGQSFNKGAELRLVDYHYLLNLKANKDRANTFSAAQTFSSTVAFSGTTNPGLGVNSLTEAQRDALSSPANGTIIYNSTSGQIEFREGGAWNANAAGSTVADGSTTVAGKVEIATDAEIRSETATGGTGAALVIPASATAVLKDDRMVLKDATELTIASGVVTVTQPYHRIDTESDAAGDDLVTITAAVGAGEMIFLRLENSARIVNFKDGDGNIIIPGGDLTLADPDEVLCFISDGTNWRLVGGREGIVGEMKIWTTDTAPTGYSLCAGAALSRTTYSNLFDRIGTTYGSGDGSSTFNIPDLRGRFPLGQDDMTGSAANRVTDTDADTLGLADGAETVTLTTAQLPSHSHTLALRLLSTSNGSGGAIAETGGSNAGPTGSTGSGEAHPNMPPYITLNYIIKI